MSSLIYEMLKGAETAGFSRREYRRFSAGFFDELKPDDIVILELSSFQLQDLNKSPFITVVLEISEDHLDHHKDLDEYIEAKKNVVKFQKATDFAVIDADNEVSNSFQKHEGKSF